MENFYFQASFNEAGARTPRIDVHDAEQPARVYSFNEAGARTPRIDLFYNLLLPKAISPCFRAVVCHAN